MWHPSPAHPAVFISVDGSGKFYLCNLMQILVYVINMRCSSAHTSSHPLCCHACAFSLFPPLPLSSPSPLSRLLCRRHCPPSVIAPSLASSVAPPSGAATVLLMSATVTSRHRYCEQILLCFGGWLDDTCDTPLFIYPSVLAHSLTNLLEIHRRLSKNSSLELVASHARRCMHGTSSTRAGKQV
jgi:hypothetical protein